MNKNNWFYLFATNFVGVFNDNFLKYAIIYIAIAWNLPEWLNSSQLISIVSAALVIPYLFLSPLSGRLSMLYNKQHILVMCKWIELPIILIAILGYMLQNIWLPIIAVFLMGIQSCLYSPAKYGLIRDIGGKDGVSMGSGIFETMAFLGILLGTVTASYLSDHYKLWIFIVVILALALLGIIFSKAIRVKEQPVEENKSSLNPLRFLKDCYCFARSYPALNLAVFGASMLWFLGSLLQMNLVLHTTHTLGCSNTQSGILIAVSALGIALGCYISGLLSGKKVRTIFIIIGLSGMALSVASILLFRPNYHQLFFPIALTAFFGGFFQVPCLAIVQRSDVGRRLSDMLAYVNLITFILVLLSTLFFSLITSITNQNSYAVFALILLSILVTLLVFIFNKKRLNDFNNHYNV